MQGFPLSCIFPSQPGQGRVVPRIHPLLPLFPLASGLTDDESLLNGQRTFIILGEAFMQGFYTVFDNQNPEKPRIGLAPVCKQSQVLCVGKQSQCAKHQAIRSR